jgi:hypothetical protein
MPARNPASQARWVALAGATTRLSRSMSSSVNGAVLGMMAEADISTPMLRLMPYQNAFARDCNGAGAIKKNIAASRLRARCPFYFRAEVETKCLPGLPATPRLLVSQDGSEKRESFPDALVF